MAQQDRCAFCGESLSSRDRTCPHCGAENPGFLPESAASPAGSGNRPKTIEELQTYCASRGMPLERMRFFIGEAYKQPRAFGIYRDGPIPRGRSHGRERVFSRASSSRLPFSDLKIVYHVFCRRMARRLPGPASAFGASARAAEYPGIPPRPCPRLLYAKTPLRQKPERGKGVAGSSRHGTIPKLPLTKDYPQSDRSRIAGQDRSLLHCGSTPLFLLPAPV